MRHGALKKVALTAAAICIFGSISAMAVGRASVYIAHSSRQEAVKTYGEALELQKSLNGKVKSVEKFANGYEFSEAVPVYLSEQDDAGNTMKDSTLVNYIYEADGRESVTLEGQYGQGQDGYRPQESRALDNGVVLSYSSLQNKFVPPDYKMTEEEERLVAEGLLNVGYGTDTIEESVSSTVYWTEDGVEYSLFTFDQAMTADEMFDMAEEIAEQ